MIINLVAGDRARRAQLKFGITALAFAVLAVVAFATSDRVEANACNSGCIAAYNQCRIATNNSPSCQSKLQACVRRCIRR